MNKAYPIILEPADEGGYIVHIPDFNISTQGVDYADALYMARDAISLMGIDMISDKKDIPKAQDFDSVVTNSNQIKLLVDVDFEKYRREYDTKSVRKNCTIPEWLNEEAIRKGINFSQVLQEALKQQLNISTR